MGFETIADLDCDTTITLGGRDKKTGKKNPTNYQGYYIGSKTTEGGKFGPSMLHIFQNEDKKSNTGVWGKTNMDQKLAEVTPGQLCRVEYVGEVDTGKGNPMKKFKVQVDKSQTIEVASVKQDSEEGSEYENATDEGEEEQQFEAEDDEQADDSDLDEEENEQLDEAPAERARPPKTTAKAPSSDAQRRVQERLRGNKSA